MPQLKAQGDQIFERISLEIGRINHLYPHQFIAKNITTEDGEPMVDERDIKNPALGLSTVLRSVRSTQVPKNVSQRIALMAAITALMPFASAGMLRKVATTKHALNNLILAALGENPGWPEVQDRLHNWRKRLESAEDLSEDEQAALAFQGGVQMYHAWLQLVMKSAQNHVEENNEPVLFERDNKSLSQRMLGPADPTEIKEVEEEDWDLLNEELYEYFQNFSPQRMNQLGPRENRVRIFVYSPAGLMLIRIGKISDKMIPSPEMRYRVQMSEILPLIEPDPRGLGVDPTMESLAALTQSLGAERQQEVRTLIQDRVHSYYSYYYRQIRETQTRFQQLHIYGNIFWFDHTAPAGSNETMSEIEYEIAGKNTWKASTRVIAIMQTGKEVFKEIVKLNWGSQPTVTLGLENKRPSPEVSLYRMILRPDNYGLSATQLQALMQWRDNMLEQENVMRELTEHAQEMLS